MQFLLILLLLVYGCDRKPTVERDAHSASGMIEIGFARRVLVDHSNFATLFETFSDTYPVTTWTDSGGTVRAVTGDGYFQGCPDEPRGPASGKDWCAEAFEDRNGNGWFDGAFLAGFGSSRAAQGVLDPIEVVAWALRVGDVTAAFATIDAVGYHYSEVERIASALHDDGIDLAAMIVSSTHSHESPDLMGQWGPDASADLGLPITTGARPAYLQHVRRQTAAAIAEAVAAARPARLCVGRGDSSINPDLAGWPPEHLPIAYSRSGADLDYPDAPDARKYLIEGLENDWRDPFIVNHHINTLQARSADGTVLGTVVNVHSHAETLWASNRLASADYPGRLRARLEHLFPGSIGIAVVGSVGGIIGPHEVPLGRRDAEGNRVLTDLIDLAGNPVTDPATGRPYQVPDIAENTSEDQIVALGAAYADIAAAAINDAPCFDHGTIRAAEREFMMPLHNPAFVLASFLRIFPRSAYDAAGNPYGTVRGDVLHAFGDYADRPLAYVKTKVSAVRMEFGGEALTVLSAPGEMFPEQVIGLPANIDDADQTHKYWPQGREKHLANPRLQYVLRDLFLSGDAGAEREHYLLYGLGNDELGYLVPEYDFIRYHPLLDDEPADHYEESNSVGPDNESTLAAIYASLRDLILR